jgi:hypothetical protein
MNKLLVPEWPTFTDVYSFTVSYTTGLTEFYCGSNEPSHASQFKWLEYTFKVLAFTFVDIVTHFSSVAEP